MEIGSQSGKYALPVYGENCRDYVGRVLFTSYYVDPWVSNLAGWTEAMGSHDPFPQEGSNEEFHMDMVKVLCLGDRSVLVG